jgi:hypothetical protein
LFEKDECECQKGIWRPAWSWERGRWLTPQFQPYQWLEEAPPPSPPYEWKEALSFFKLERYVLESVAELNLFAARSALICEYNFTGSSLDWLVCNCLSDSSRECGSPASSGVGVARVCKDRATDLVVPSAHIEFSEDSMREGCASVQVLYLPQDGYSFARQKTSITAQFEKANTAGIVKNKQGTTVGKLVGDGIELTLQFPSHLSLGTSALAFFELCLFARDAEQVGNTYMVGL